MEIDEVQGSTASGESGFDRRTLLRRGAVVGGAAVWATPVVQSLARPAFAAGSPVCVNSFRFKYETNDGGGGRFDNGIPAPGSTAEDCVPPEYSQTPDAVGDDGAIPGHPGEFVVIQLVDPTRARILLPTDCILLAGDGKAGGKNNLECEEATFLGTQDGRNVYQVDLDKGISFIAGVVCCS